MKTLYVSALPFQTDEHALRELFAPFGTIAKITVHADWQKPTFEPYALIEMDNADAAVDALDGKMIGQTLLRVHPRVCHRQVCKELAG